MTDFISDLPNSNIQIEDFSVLNITKYDEEILTIIQQLLKKVKVKKFRITLHCDVTNTTQTDICSKFSKKLFELDMAINEETTLIVYKRFEFEDLSLLKAKLKKGQQP